MGTLFLFNDFARYITEMGVIEVTPEGMTLVELYPDFIEEQVR